MEAILACHPALSTEWTGWQNRVNYDAFAQAPFLILGLELAENPLKMAISLSFPCQNFGYRGATLRQDPPPPL